MNDSHSSVDGKSPVTWIRVEEKRGRYVDAKMRSRTRAWHGRGVRAGMGGGAWKFPHENYSNRKIYIKDGSQATFCHDMMPPTSQDTHRGTKKSGATCMDQTSGEQTIIFFNYFLLNQNTFYRRSIYYETDHHRPLFPQLTIGANSPPPPLPVRLQYACTKPCHHHLPNS